MAIYQGARYQVQFTIKDQDDVAIDISTWTFHAQIRQKLDDAAALLDLVSEFSFIDAVNGRLQLTLTATQTETLPLGKVVFDVMRTDVSPGPEWLFGGTFKVKQPVTRDE